MESSELGVGPSSSAARKVLKKIDRVIIPLLFVTYMLNFMDKTILSSAAVFGLRDDNVGNSELLRWSFRLMTGYSTSKDNSTAGSPASSTLVT